ncbi:hypothetical protein ACE38V_16875 [Cytobacillus sp. Hz8]|uniref:hypothetical protein n=1 Tax=Cytobacillus sp. Hz8 TaxID=3347168 RepID=UPI0035D75FEC
MSVISEIRFFFGLQPLEKSIRLCVTNHQWGMNGRLKARRQSQRLHTSRPVRRKPPLMEVSLYGEAISFQRFDGILVDPNLIKRLIENPNIL